MARRGLNRFDTSLLTNDGGKYSPSTRRLRQNYLHDIKGFTGKAFSSPTQSQPSSPTAAIATQVSERTSTQLSPSHHQSSIDFMTLSLKCDDCQKHDGLFQCCHCNQRLCIRCCNKHYKKVTIELEHLHELSDHLVTKIINTKSDLERQKNETLEQCHQWRIDTINKINKAHALIIQTLHDEYEILGKEYDLFVEKEISLININKNELIRMKKGNLASLFSSLSSTIDSTNSIDTIKKRIQTFTKCLDETGIFLFQVKLPTFNIDDTLRVESRLGDITRSTSAAWQNEDGLIDTPSIEIEKEISTKSQTINSSPPVHETDDSSDTFSIEKDNELQSSFPPNDSAYETTSSSSNSLLHNQPEHSSLISSLHQSSSNQFINNSFFNNRRHTHTFHRTSSPPFYETNNNNDEDTYQSVQHVQLKRQQDASLEGVAIQIEKSQENDGIIERRRTAMQACGVRRRTIALTPGPPPPSSHLDRLTNNQPRWYYRTNSMPPFT